MGHETGIDAKNLPQSLHDLQLVYSGLFPSWVQDTRYSDLYSMLNTNIRGPSPYSELGKRYGHVGPICTPQQPYFVSPYG